jgi:hypothetical protein
MNMYESFLRSKIARANPCGFSPPRLNRNLFPFQRDVVRWAIQRGGAALFEDCGLGKTLQELDWAHSVSAHTKQPVLILTPLAVAQQTAEEGAKFGIPVTVARDASEIQPGVNVTNYEKLHHFKPDFGGIVLDESSILKAFDGKTRKALTDFARDIPYRLCATATPAPNDYMELGNHAEFLGVMTATEMLSMFFVHDGGDTSKWRLKRHATDAFWRWVCSWAVAIRKPSDLGYEDGRFILPRLHMHQITVHTENAPVGFLFAVEGETLQERNAARRSSIADRVRACADLVNRSDEQWVVWCNLNDESAALTSAIPDAVEVKGADSDTHKESTAREFVHGRVRVIVSKPSIFGWGMNWQNCRNIAFVGLSDSYEQLYQAIRRCWRFGQEREVNCYVITADTEGPVVRNIQRKEKQAIEMMDGMVEHMKDEMNKEVRQCQRDKSPYVEGVQRSEPWELWHGDCVEHVARMASDSIGYSIFSPPFASLYTYSNSERDMGNARDYEEFEQHFKYLLPELYRVIQPGRLLSFHCMNLPLTKERDGIIGIRDFRGELVRMFVGAGFVFHSEVCIWKDPVTAMQRTKAIGLLYKQLKKDSAMSRQGIPDYLVTMRKPGVNPSPVTKDPEYFPVELWQRYASPVWMDINPSDTLQRESAREEEDERHICPLQLQVIERAIELWTNPGDLVLDPFAGIASTGYVALKMQRRFVGVELKQSYFDQGCKNLRQAEHDAGAQGGLFD